RRVFDCQIRFRRTRSSNKDPVCSHRLPARRRRKPAKRLETPLLATARKVFGQLSLKDSSPAVRSKSMEPGIRFRRALWGAVIFLAFIGAVVAVRRIAHLGPILANGYSSPAVVPGSRGGQFVQLDEVFARHPILNMIHIVPGLLFMILGPFQFSESIR